MTLSELLSQLKLAAEKATPYKAEDFTGFAGLFQNDEPAFLRPNDIRYFRRVNPPTILALVECFELLIEEARYTDEVGYDVWDEIKQPLDKICEGLDK